MKQLAVACAFSAAALFAWLAAPHPLFGDSSKKATKETAMKNEMQVRIAELEIHPEWLNLSVAVERPQL